MKQIKNVLEIVEMVQQGYTFSPQIRNSKGETIKPFEITDANGNDVTTDYELKSVNHYIVKCLNFQRDNILFSFQKYLEEKVEYCHIFDDGNEGWCIGIIASDLNIEEMYAHIADYFKNEYKIIVSFERSVLKKEKCKFNHTLNEYLFAPCMDIVETID